MCSLITRLALLTAVVSFIGPVASAQLQGRFSLEKKQFKVGEPAFLNFDLTNQGKEPIQFLRGNRYSYCGGYTIDVSSAPPLRHSSCEQGFAGSCVASTQLIAPGQTRHEAILLNYEHDLSKSGAYDIHAIWTANYGPRTEDFQLPAGKQQIRVEDEFRIELVDPEGENFEPLFQPYVASLTSGDEERRMEAARVIGSLAPPFLEDTLVSMLSIPAARSFALRGLKKLNTPRSREVLAGIIQSAPDYSYEKEQIIRYLSDLGDKKYFPLLLDIAQKEPPNQARDYILAAARLGGEDAMPFIESLLSDSDPFSQGNGVMALSETGSRSAIPILIENLKNPSLQLGTLALVGLRQLTHRSLFVDGQIYRETPSQQYPSWSRWWFLYGKSAPVYQPQQCGEILPLT